MRRPMRRHVAAAKHKIRVAWPGRIAASSAASSSSCSSSSSSTCDNLQNTNQIVQWRRKNDQKCAASKGARRHFYLQHCHFRRPFARAPPTPTFASERAKSCKLMATGAHSKRFHYCHKLLPRHHLLLLHRLHSRLLLHFPEDSAKNFPAYFSISAT